MAFFQSDCCPLERRPRRAKFLLFPPTFVVDGQVMKGKWREPTTIPVAAGSHTVKIFFRYLFIMDAGVGEAQVTVADGAVTRVGYKAPWLVFLKGRMTVG